LIQNINTIQALGLYLKSACTLGKKDWSINLNHLKNFYRKKNNVTNYKKKLMSYNKYLVKVNIKSNQACLRRCETKEGKKINLTQCCIVLIDEGEKHI
jgi:hypothetical protein